MQSPELSPDIFYRLKSDCELYLFENISNYKIGYNRGEYVSENGKTLEEYFKILWPLVDEKSISGSTIEIILEAPITLDCLLGMVLSLKHSPHLFKYYPMDILSNTLAWIERTLTISDRRSKLCGNDDLTILRKTLILLSKMQSITTESTDKFVGTWSQLWGKLTGIENQTPPEAFRKAFRRCVEKNYSRVITLPDNNHKSSITIKNPDATLNLLRKEPSLKSHFPK